MVKKERNYKIDLIKVIGLFAIILAHVQPHETVFQIRNFDVPLMVFVSGFLSYDSYNSSKSYLHHVFKRIKRLAIPTWLFLVFYFFVLLILNRRFGVVFPYDKKQVIDSFLFLDGIGYIWIVRVYLLIELLLPLFIKILNKFDKKIIVLIIGLLLIINEIFCVKGIYNLCWFNSYILSIVISYGTISFMGLFSKKCSRQSYLWTSILFLIIFSIYALYYYKVTGVFVYTQVKKYPPQMYYLSYALVITYLLFFINVKLKNNIIRKIIVFISKSSFSIYLWHIFSIFLVTLFVPNIKWYFKYLIIILLSFIIVIIRNYIVSKCKTLINKHDNIDK